MVWRRWLLLACWLAWAPPALAVSPYVAGDKVVCDSLAACVNRVAQKLQSAGFRVAGIHYPRGLAQYAVVVVTDKALLETIRMLGGSAVIGAGIRVGVKADGSVSYINPDYWYRAYFQKKFESHSETVKQLGNRLAKTLGARAYFGGNVAAVDLPNYRYMIGMERFDSNKSLLRSYASFGAAVKTVQDNLAKGVNHTGKVYEVVMPDKQLAVFGVALNDPQHGEVWWVRQAGAEHIAALPWEIYIVNGNVYALYARYRTALAWPALEMGAFMSISDHPDTVLEMLTGVAGGKIEKTSVF